MISQFNSLLISRGLQVEGRRDLFSNKLTYIMNDQLKAFSKQTDKMSFFEFVHKNALVVKNGESAKVVDFFSRIYNTIAKLNDSVFEVRTFLCLLVESGQDESMIESYLSIRDMLLKTMGQSTDIKVQTSGVKVSPLNLHKLLEFLHTKKEELNSFLVDSGLPIDIDHVSVDLLIQFYMTDVQRHQASANVARDADIQEFKGNLLIARTRAKLRTCMIVMKTIDSNRSLKEVNMLNDVVKQMKRLVSDKTYFRAELLKIFLKLFVGCAKSIEFSYLRAVKEGFEERLNHEKKAFFVLLSKKMNRWDMPAKDLAHHTIQLLYLKQLADLKKLVKEADRIKEHKSFEDIKKLNIMQKDLILFEFFRREAIEGFNNITKEPWQDIVKQRFVKVEDFDKDTLGFIKKAENNLNKEINYRIEKRDELISHSLNLIRDTPLMDDITNFLSANADQLSPTTRLTDLMGMLSAANQNGSNILYNEYLNEKSKIVNKTNSFRPTNNQDRTPLCQNCRQLVGSEVPLSISIKKRENGDLEDYDAEFIKNTVDANILIINYIQRKKGRASIFDKQLNLQSLDFKEPAIVPKMFASTVLSVKGGLMGQSEVFNQGNQNAFNKSVVFGKNFAVLTVPSYINALNDSIAEMLTYEASNRHNENSHVAPAACKNESGPHVRKSLLPPPAVTPRKSQLLPPMANQPRRSQLVPPSSLLTRKSFLPPPQLHERFMSLPPKYSRPRLSSLLPLSTLPKIRRSLLLPPAVFGKIRKSFLPPQMGKVRFSLLTAPELKPRRSNLIPPPTEQKMDYGMLGTSRVRKSLLPPPSIHLRSHSLPPTMARPHFSTLIPPPNNARTSILQFVHYQEHTEVIELIPKGPRKSTLTALVIMPNKSLLPPPALKSQQLIKGIIAKTMARSFLQPPVLPTKKSLLLPPPIQPKQLLKMMLAKDLVKSFLPPPMLLPRKSKLVPPSLNDVKLVRSFISKTMVRSFLPPPILPPKRSLLAPPPLSGTQFIETMVTKAMAKSFLAPPVLPSCKSKLVPPPLNDVKLVRAFIAKTMAKLFLPPPVLPVRQSKLVPLPLTDVKLVRAFIAKTMARSILPPPVLPPKKSSLAAPPLQPYQLIKIMVAKALVKSFLPPPMLLPHKSKLASPAIQPKSFIKGMVANLMVRSSLAPPVLPSKKSLLLPPPVKSQNLIKTILAKQIVKSCLPPPVLQQRRSKLLPPSLIANIESLVTKEKTESSNTSIPRVGKDTNDLPKSPITNADQEIVEPSVKNNFKESQIQYTPSKNAFASKEASTIYDEEKGDNRKMQPLFWEKIDDSQVPNSLWSEILCKNHNVPLNRIYQYFESTDAETKNALMKAKLNEVDLINDPKRLEFITTRINKVVEQTSLGLNEIAEVVLKIDEKRVGYEVFLSLKELSPLAVELEKANLFNKSLGSLNLASRWLITIKDVPRYSYRIEALSLQNEIENLYAGYREFINTFFSTCEMLGENIPFQRFMRVCLDAGNILNANTQRGEATGFTLTSLKEFIKCTSIVKSGVSLMEYIMIEVSLSNPRLLEFVEDLKTKCEKSASWNIEDVVNGIRTLKGKLNLLRAHLEAAERSQPSDIWFIARYQDFFLNNGEKIVLLEEEGLRTIEFYYEVMMLLGENSRKLKANKSIDQMRVLSAIFTEMQGLLHNIQNY